ncbi:MAG: Holliday junction branch migration DNA helicase RuvB [Planctomycetes bacterium]|nr:Holliday junction branch migration DNA helicase RuvB [Planctomycetota bacterium]
MKVDDVRMVSPRALDLEREAENPLRPKSFDEFVGQESAVRNLRVYLRAARERGEAVDHILFSGLPGLGKTTLATLIAAEMGTRLVSTSGPALERAADLAGILTNLQRGDCLFIDEIHRTGVVVQEYLHSAMEDFAIDIVMDQGPSARTLRLELAPFTLIGATTRQGLLAAAFRNRFPIHEKLEPYPPEDLVRIALRSARLLSVELDAAAAETVAARARGTPRVANRILRRLRDVAQVAGEGRIDERVAEEGMRMLGLDERGLDAVDRKLLDSILAAGGGPVGLKTLAVMVGETEDTLEDVYEPFLIQQGLLLRTPRGRVTTPEARRALGRPVAQRSLF